MHMKAKEDQKAVEKQLKKTPELAPKKARR